MVTNNFINLDANAGLDADTELWRYLEAALKGCLNPSSIHQGGQRAKFLIEEAREDLKSLVNAGNARVIFTSGASEANNLIINSIFRDRSELSNSHLIVSAVEHMSVLEPAKRLEAEGLEVSFVKPQPKKAYRPEDFTKEIRKETKMLAVMYANNESGEILPIAKLVQIFKVKRPDIFIFSDAVQTLGKENFNFSDSSLDAVSISGHKIGALPGTGALIINDDYLISPQLLGGPQEQRLRAGTENLPGIISLGYRAKKIKSEIKERAKKMTAGRELVLRTIFEKLPDASLNCFSKSFLPNTINLRIPGIRSDDLVVSLDLEGVLISSASACASGKPLPSHVLLASGFSDEEATSSIRISLHEKYTSEELVTAANKIISAVDRMRT